MSDVLFVKTSSLGDVIHHMPALTEARAQRPAFRFAWVVEEAFAPLVRLHPAVDDVIPVASRRWRRSLPGPLDMARGRTILARAARAELRCDHRHAGPDPIRADRARGTRPPPRLRRRQHPRACGVAVLRCPAQRRARPACDCAQPRLDRSCARLFARGTAGLRARPRKTVRRRRRIGTRCCCTQPRSARRNGRWSIGSRSANRCARATSGWCCRGAMPASRSAAARSRPRCPMPKCPICNRSTRSRA